MKKELDAERRHIPFGSPLRRPRVVTLIEAFGREMQERQFDGAGLLKSALGKARGDALRLSLVLEYLWWCGKSGMEAPPREISARAFVSGARLVEGYFLPMAERVYGDAAIPAEERRVTNLARWIYRNRPPELYVREFLRRVTLPLLSTADEIHAAANALIEAGWLRAPPKGTFGARARQAYAINPKLWDAPA